MKTKLKPSSKENDIATYRKIRKAIGWLGMILPFALVLLSLIPPFETKVQKSISNYYFTNFRELFTGTLCAVSLFLIRYKGYRNPVFWKNDGLMTNIAGVMALGVALIPTNPDTCPEKIYTLIPSCLPFLGWIHYFFAGSLFLILADISINIFVIGQKETSDIPISLLNENNLYMIFGYSIIAFIILIPVGALLKFTYSTLVLEALTLVAFGSSWLIKGRFLGDKGKIGRVLYREHHE